jgi:hypothetical protein
MLPVLLSNYDLNSIIDNPSMLMDMGSFKIGPLGQDFSIVFNFCRFGIEKMNQGGVADAMRTSLAMFQCFKSEKDEAEVMQRCAKAIAIHVDEFLAYPRKRYAEDNGQIQNDGNNNVNQGNGVTSLTQFLNR